MSVTLSLTTSTHLTHTRLQAPLYTLCKETTGLSLGKVIHCDRITKFDYVQNFVDSHL